MTLFATGSLTLLQSTCYFPSTTFFNGHTLGSYLLHLHLVKLFLKIIYWNNLTFYSSSSNIHKKNVTFITSFLIHNCLSDHLCEQIIACGFFSELPIVPRHLANKAGFIRHSYIHTYIFIYISLSYTLWYAATTLSETELGMSQLKAQFILAWVNSHQSSNGLKCFQDHMELKLPTEGKLESTEFKDTA